MFCTGQTPVINLRVFLIVKIRKKYRFVVAKIYYIVRFLRHFGHSWLVQGHDVLCKVIMILIFIVSRSLYMSSKVKW